MDPKTLQIKMLGGFSIRRGEREIKVGPRSRKLSLLLAFLIWERNRLVPYGELSILLGMGQASGPAALNALKALLHRARSLLEQLWEGAGRELILSREGGCQWDPETPVLLDAEEFARLCQAAEEDAPQRLEPVLEALALYSGDFLPWLADYPWAGGQNRQLHEQYLRTVLSTLPQLLEAERYSEALELSRTAFALEPGSEELCRTYLESLLRLDRRQEAVRVFEGFQERLLARLGVMPSDPLRELYRQAQRNSEPRAVSPVTLLEHLMDQPETGALLCEYDFFRAICQTLSRMADRTRTRLHVALISVTSGERASLARYSLDRAMDHLQEVIRAHLRRGDVFARCSASQFVLLLPQAGYEDSRMICSRITRAFVRRYPHSPALLEVSVQPVLFRK